MKMKSSVDFVIVTALDEERDAVLQKLPGYNKLPPKKNTVQTYYSAQVPVIFPDSSTGQYRLIVVSLSGMGRIQAATVTNEAIARWHPRYVMLVGIAGGIAAKHVNIGDILISSQIVDYELQKITKDGPQVRWEVYRAEPRLLAASHNFSDKEWLDLVSVARPVDGKLVRHVGPLASGDKVIAFSDVLNIYRDKWPALIGVEMEAGGTAAAAFQSAEPPGFFMVRGVSDLADSDKNIPDVEKWRPYACDVAASYAIGLLKSGPVVTSEPVSQPRQQIPLDQRAQPDMPLVLIPAGSFWLGAVPGDLQALENEKPGREIFWDKFQISRYPVTNRQYAQFVKAAKYQVPTHWVNGQFPVELADHPVVNVSFEDAETYCHWLSQTTQQSYRLPIEAEWEKAARGPLPDKVCYVWGNAWRNKACNTKELGLARTTSVSEFEATNRSPFGAVDLLGNVWEWTSSWYEAYPGSHHESLNFGRNYRAVRGGSWNNPEKDARISCRGRYASNTRREYLGFRMVLDIVTQQPSTDTPSISYSVAISKPDATKTNDELQHDVDQVKMHEILTQRFNLEELKDLCFRLYIDYESLPSVGKSGKARELISYCQRRSRMMDLVLQIEQLRPDVIW
jgi:formylglycine-generating enzyme required for sulfatase activity